MSDFNKPAFLLPLTMIAVGLIFCIVATIMAIL